jgi:hypothetical protein
VAGMFWQKRFFTYLTSFSACQMLSLDKQEMELNERVNEYKHIFRQNNLTE